jgi:hypothetical protein
MQTYVDETLCGSEQSRDGEQHKATLEHSLALEEGFSLGLVS